MEHTRAPEKVGYPGLELSESPPVYYKLIVKRYPPAFGKKEGFKSILKTQRGFLPTTLMLESSSIVEDLDN